jgi:AcrR family transcriptional regulator
MATEPNTRERIITEAMRLFAERGFAGTTVGEIEEAAGLAPRAGGLYKHFASKRAVLEAGIQRHVNELEGLRPVMEMLPLGDLRAELTLIGRLGLQELASEIPLIKLVQKEGDRFPELAAAMDERIIERAQVQGVGVVSRLVGDALDEAEVAALAAVARLALVGYRIEEVMFGPRPIPEDDFLEAWVDVLMAYAERQGVAGAAIASETG